MELIFLRALCAAVVKKLTKHYSLDDSSLPCLNISNGCETWPVAALEVFWSPVLILEHVIHVNDIAIINVCKQRRGYMRKRRITAGNWLGSWHLEEDLDHQHYHHPARAIMSFTLSLSPPSPILQPSHLFCWKTWDATSARTNTRSGQLCRHVDTSLMQNT